MSNKLEKGFNQPDGGGIFEKRPDFGRSKYVCRECGADISEYDWLCPNCGQPDVQNNKTLRSQFPGHENKK